MSEDIFTIHYTPEYVQEVTGLDMPDCKRLLYWLYKMYDENKAITRAYLCELAKGIRGGIL